MARRLLLFLLALMPILCMHAQDSKKVRALKTERTNLQKNLKKSEAALTAAKQKVTSGQQVLRKIGGKLDSTLVRVEDMRQGFDTIDQNISDVQSGIASLESDIYVKRQELKAALRHAYLQRRINKSSLYVLSGKNFHQIYRRARYARDYAAYQRLLGQQIVARQNELLQAQGALIAAKNQLVDTARTVMAERTKLNEQHVQQERVVANLKKQESTAAQTVKDQKKKLAALDKEIERLIAYEIEQARKRAEEEARRKAEAAKKKKQGSSSSGKAGSTSTQTKPDVWLTAEDKKLNGSFEQNKGRLPVPITGKYRIGGRYGTYTVSGTQDVVLDNKGTNFIGQKGAQARSIFSGKVTAIFQFNGAMNILVRHGSYISVYINLKSVSVKKGQNVNARDILGNVAEDGSGNCLLQFQLRKETTKLNPEAWIGK